MSGGRLPESAASSDESTIANHQSGCRNDVTRVFFYQLILVYICQCTHSILTDVDVYELLRRYMHCLLMSVCLLSVLWYKRSPDIPVVSKCM